MMEGGTEGGAVRGREGGKENGEGWMLERRDRGGRERMKGQGDIHACIDTCTVVVPRLWVNMGTGVHVEGTYIIHVHV